MITDKFKVKSEIKAQCNYIKARCNYIKGRCNYIKGRCNLNGNTIADAFDKNYMSCISLVQ